MVKVGLNAEPNSSGIIENQDKSVGIKGTDNYSSTASHSGSWFAIQAIQDSVFETLTETLSSGSITTLTINAGIILYGNFTVIKLTSGTVRAYKN